MMGPAPIKVSLAEWECQSTKTMVCSAINAVQRHNKTPEMLQGIYMGHTRETRGRLPFLRLRLLNPQPRTNVAKAVSWSAMKPRVAGSVNSPVAASIFVLTWGMMTSGLFRTRPSR